jgi:hypothetical protein
MANNTKGQKELLTRWPVEEGLTAGTQKQTGRITNLIPQESSKVPKRIKVGL